MAPGMQIEDWLDDLCVRFIINLPEEDLSSVARICFQVEEAQWFYEDFIRPLDPTLPSMTLRTFCLRMFQHCPLLAHFSADNHTKAFEEFLEYKTRVPVRGAILLNQAMDSMLLVKGWKKGATWTFPGGKINKDEDDLDCAVREVWEETGLDLHVAGLVPSEGKPKYIEIPIRNHQVRLYVFRDVPMDYYFEPQTRKEISKIEWYRLSDLPAFRKKHANNDQTNVPGANKFYMIAPFMVPLKKWIASQKRQDERRPISADHNYLQAQAPIEEVPSETEGWLQSESHMLTRTSAMATLDDATQELQRLLKLQSPAYNPQQQQQQQQQFGQVPGGDKGSELLSILQANKPADSEGISLQYNHQSHTPYGAVYNQQPQPQNLHQTTNQQQMPTSTQQPPPSFPLPGYHGSQGWEQGQPPVQHQTFQAPPHNYSYETAEQHQGLHHHNQSPVALLHPQPLPPQVQRAVFNQSTFQDASFVGNMDGTSQGRGPPQYQPTTIHGQAPPQMPPNSYGHAGPSGPTDAARTQAPMASLSGQSKALLDAFKRSPAPARAAQPPQPVKRPSVEVFSQAPSSNQYPQYSVSQADTQQTNDANIPKPMHHKNPSELPGAAPGLSADHHKSALLGMFKKATPDTSSVQKLPQPQVQLPNPALQGASGYAQQLPHQSPPTTGGRAAGGQATQGALDKRMEHLALFTRKDAQATTVPQVVPPRQNSQAFVNRHPAQTHNQTQQVPVRILQRGQDAHAFEVTSPPKAAAEPSPNQARTTAAVVPHLSPSAYQQQAQAGVDHRRPSGASGTSDQKRQLLSLFGGSKQSPVSAMTRTSSQGSQGLNPLTQGNTAALTMATMTSNKSQPAVSVGHADNDHYGPSSKASSRRGGSNNGDKTPMSPADQSFLLGYLQSVTGTSK